jgi:hypothetical protein
VEASPIWAIGLLHYAYARPEIAKKMRLYWAPADWNPTFRQKCKYWKENKALIDYKDAIILERSFLDATFSACNVWVFDGAIRKMAFAKKVSAACKEAEIVMVDNTEVHFIESAQCLDPHFRRLDFIETDLARIPAHQKGKHITTIWVTQDRLSRSAEPEAGEPTCLSLDAWFDYVQVAPEERSARRAAALQALDAYRARPL